MSTFGLEVLWLKYAFIQVTRFELNYLFYHYHTMNDPLKLHYLGITLENISLCKFCIIYVMSRYFYVIKSDLLLIPPFSYVLFFGTELIKGICIFQLSNPSMLCQFSRMCDHITYHGSYPPLICFACSWRLGSNIKNRENSFR